MKKIKLNLDDLRVESFHTTPEAETTRVGTVFGLGDRPLESLACFSGMLTCGDRCYTDVSCGGATCNSCPADC